MTTLLYIYEYNPDSLEYTGKKEAEADPEETKLRKQFVPLVPRFATLIEPPKNTDEEHKAVIFNPNTNNWEIVIDYRKNYRLVDENLNISSINTITKPENGIVVSEDLANKIKANPDDYKIENNKIAKKTAKEKEKERKERISLLSLTKREIFLALYHSKQITPEMLEAQITEPEALIEFKYANEYYRGNPLVSEIGKKLGYTEDEIDYLFENKELPSK